MIRPVEIILANALGMELAVEELRFRLFPGVYHPFTSDVLSKGLKNDASQHIGQAIGLSVFRDLQSNIVDQHKDPEAVEVKVSENAADLQQGHSSLTAETYYLVRPDRPSDSVRGAISAYRRASSWWQHLTGIVFPLILLGWVLTSFRRNSTTGCTCQSRSGNHIRTDQCFEHGLAFRVRVASQRAGRST